MPARPIWRGQIRLALVSIPVELFPATKSGAQIQFHQVHEPSGKRIKYEKVVPGIGPVDRDEIVKGYEISKGQYVLLDPEEIESVKLESRKTLDLVQFVDEDEIDATFFDKPYYMVPADDLAEEAGRFMNLVGVAQSLEQDSTPAGLQGDDIFLAAHRQLADAVFLRPPKRLADDDECLFREIVRRHDIIRLVEIHGVDVA